MTEEIKEFDKIEVIEATEVTEPAKKIKDKIESKPKRKYKKDKKKTKDKNVDNLPIPEDIHNDVYTNEMTRYGLDDDLPEKRRKFLKHLESKFVYKEFVRYKERIFEIQTFKCDANGKGHIELFNKKFSCTIGLLIENLAEHHFEFDL